MKVNTLGYFDFDGNWHDDDGILTWYDPTTGTLDTAVVAPIADSSGNAAITITYVPPAPPATVAAMLTTFNQSNFNADITAQYVNQLATPFRGAPYYLTDAQLMTAVPVFGNQHIAQTGSMYTEGSNYRAIAARVVSDALDAKGFPGGAWYASPVITLLVQQGSAEGIQRWQATQVSPDNWLSAIGIIVAIGIAIVTGGGGLIGLVSDALSEAGAAAAGAAASADAAATLIAAENAIDVASLISTVGDAGAMVSSNISTLIEANDYANTLLVNATDATQQATQIANMVQAVDNPSLQLTMDQFVQATQTIEEHAASLVDTTQGALENISNQTQALNETIDTVNQTFENSPIQLDENVVPSIPNIDPPSIPSPTLPDFPTIDNPVTSFTPATPDFPTINDTTAKLPLQVTDLKTIADKIGQTVSNVTPSQAFSLASTLYKLIAGVPNTPSAVYARQPGGPSTYGQLQRYYDSLNADNNYGIRPNLSPLYKQLGIPALILLGAYLLSKR